MATNHEDEPARPYRLWDPHDGVYLQWRYYKWPRNAHLGALIECRWSKPGAVVEVIDIRTSALLGQYRRTPTSVAFTQIKRGSDAEQAD